MNAEPEALAMIARAADGSMRDALSLADQVLAMGDGALSAERAREALGLVPEDEYVRLLDIIAERRASDEGQEGLRAFLEKRRADWRRD